MVTRRFLTGANIFFIVVVIALTASLFFDTPRLYAQEYLGVSKITTGLAYLFVVITTTVFAPFAGLPLAPAVSIIVGPFLTAILSVVGWTIGAIVAFLIARHLARPFLTNFINMKRIELYESYIPQKHLFLWLTFLRVIVPVDILSYAIGLTKSVKLPIYIVTTIIGVIPFSFIWSYGGHALIEQNYSMFYIMSAIGVALFFLSLVYYYAHNHKK